MSEFYCHYTIEIRHSGVVTWTLVRTEDSEVDAMSAARVMLDVLKCLTKLEVRVRKIEESEVLRLGGVSG